MSSDQEGAPPAALGFRMPAEWEPHRATWLAWPHNASDWPGKGLMVEWVFAEIARVLSGVERVRMVVADAREQRRAARVLGRSGVDLAKVDFFRAPTDRSWTRDFLPTFVVKRAGKKRELAAVKWRFNAWARYSDFRRDDAAGDAVAERYAARVFRPLFSHGRRRARVVLEGGALDVDGRGTLLTTTSCLLSGRYARNPALGRVGTERMLSEQLGIEQVIWLPDGIAGDDTSGHVDDFARFVAPGRVVVCSEPNGRDRNHRPLRRAREVLESARDSRGKKLEVIPLPMPSPVFFAKQRLPASYANFYFANELVLVPTFADPRDREALGLFGELFPDRSVVGIHCRDLVLGLGTLHCSTQQEPA